MGFGLTMGSERKTLKELRTFGFAFGSGLTVMGGLLLWRERPAGPWVLGVAAAVLLLGAVAPRMLTPLKWVMETIFHAVTVALTYVILTSVFLLVLTPLGLLRRLLGQDGLGLRPDPSLESYWIDVEADGPGSRPGKPF